MADVGNKIQKYIQDIASASVASNEKAAEFAANDSEESRAKDAQFQAMTAQIQALTNTVALLLTAIAAAAKKHGGGSSSGGNNGGGGRGRGGHGRNGGGKGGEGKFNFTHNMGAYCHTHGHHPIGTKHSSTT